MKVTRKKKYRREFQVISGEGDEMRSYILPFEEHLKGIWVIEARSLEHAKEIASDSDFTETREPEYTRGSMDWDVNDIELDRVELWPVN